MSGWATMDDLGGETVVVARGSSQHVKRAFFAEEENGSNDGDNDDDDGVKLAQSSATRASRRRDSLTLPYSTTVSRRTQRGSRMQVVVDDDEDDEDDEDDAPSVSGKPLHGKRDPAQHRHAATPATRTGIHHKEDELAGPHLVSPVAVITATSVPESEAGSEARYLHALVRGFLQTHFSKEVLDCFDKEKAMTAAEATAAVEQWQARVLGPHASHVRHLATPLEQFIAAWDATQHDRAPPPARRSRRRDSGGGGTNPTDSSLAAEPGVRKKTSRKPSGSSSSSGRKKPSLTLTVNVNEAEVPAVDINEGDAGKHNGTPSDALDFNRLNHPGHTPKAQTARLASVIGEPGSTPRASAAELQSLGFDDVEPPEVPASNTTNGPVSGDDGSDDGDGVSALSQYAMRKRAANRHNKHVVFGEPGRTPTKEYVFFRETPPQYVTETIEHAEKVQHELFTRDNGAGDPHGRRASLACVATTLERFVELQSSEVSKYTIGNAVRNLGAQRNLSGLVSKLYGSRQCGTAGPGTIVVDTWFGSDAPPINDEGDEEEGGEEEDQNKIQRAPSHHVHPDSTATATALCVEDEELLEALLR